MDHIHRLMDALLAVVMFIIALRQEVTNRYLNTWNFAAIYYVLQVIKRESTKLRTSVPIFVPYFQQLFYNSSKLKECSLFFVGRVYSSYIHVLRSKHLQLILFLQRTLACVF